MATPYPADPVSRPHPRVDARRMWAGGSATALVAALIAVVGTVAARGLFGVDLLAPESAGVWGDATTAWYAGGAACAALVATALMHGFATFTPRPVRFFAWVMFLATTVGVLAPFTTGGGTGAKLATAALNLVLGVAIGSLVAGTARGAMRSGAAGRSDGTVAG